MRATMIYLLHFCRSFLVPGAIWVSQKWGHPQNGNFFSGKMRIHETWGPLVWDRQSTNINQYHICNSCPNNGSSISNPVLRMVLGIHSEWTRFSEDQSWWFPIWLNIWMGAYIKMRTNFVGLLAPPFLTPQVFHISRNILLLAGEGLLVHSATFIYWFSRICPWLVVTLLIF